MTKEYIKGGLASGISSKYFNRKQLLKGIKIEMEHTNNRRIAEEIARDHLFEDPMYYVKLEEIEKL